MVIDAFQAIWFVVLIIMLFILAVSISIGYLVWKFTGNKLYSILTVPVVFGIIFFIYIK